MKYKHELMSKNGLTIMMMARDLLGESIGSKMKTVAEYQEQTQMGRGTIQQALKFLQQNEAISITSRGHLGTIITDIDEKKVMGNC